MTSNSIRVTFIGTSSGGGPSDSRNCSSLVVDMVQNRSLWMVDCAEGTVRQFQLQPTSEAGYSKVMMSKITKLFITHMHADHIMGTITLLRTLLYPPLSPNSRYESSTDPIVEIYGPAGLRLFVRQNLKMTATRTAHKYVVHELLTSTDSPTPCLETPEGALPSSLSTQPDIMHPSETIGMDLRASEDGLWRGITEAMGNAKAKVSVDAGPILHRDPCIGYTFTEQTTPSRKLVILGDTYDPSAIVPLCSNPRPALLIHEATDSHISPHADVVGKLSKRTKEEVLAKALERGHSVPDMAGAFARRVGADMLVLNHIGSRFPAPRKARDNWRNAVMEDIESKATVAWGVPGKRARAARDFMQVEVPIPKTPTNMFAALQTDMEMGHQESDLEINEHVVEVVGHRSYSESEWADGQSYVSGRSDRGGGGSRTRGRGRAQSHVQSRGRGGGRGGARGRGGGGAGHHPHPQARGGHGGAGATRGREDDDGRSHSNKRRRVP